MKHSDELILSIDAGTQSIRAVFIDLFGNIDLFIKSLGISSHYSYMSKGVIDTRDLLYFLSLISLFIILTKISLESRKW